MDTGSFVLRVKEGETLLSLCRKFNLSFEKVIAENRLVREPAAGELLYVSRAFREMHVAEAGETYRSIAEKYGKDEGELRRLNAAEYVFFSMPVVLG